MDNIMVYTPNQAEQADKLAAIHARNNISQQKQTIIPTPPELKPLRSLIKDVTVAKSNASFAFREGFRFNISNMDTGRTLINVGGKTLAPAEFIAAALNLNVRQTETAIEIGEKAVFTVGTEEVSYDHVQIRSGHIVQQLDGEYYLPLRWTAELLGAHVLWLDSGIVVISKQPNPLGALPAELEDELVGMFNE